MQINEKIYMILDVLNEAKKIKVGDIVLIKSKKINGKVIEVGDFDVILNQIKYKIKDDSGKTKTYSDDEIKRI